MGKSKNSRKGITQSKNVSAKHKAYIKKRVNKAERIVKKKEIDEDGTKFTGKHGRINTYHTEIGEDKCFQNWVHKKK